MEWVLFIVWVCIPMGAGSWIGWKVKGRPLTGFLLGTFLGWIGVIIIACVPPAAEMRVQNRLRDDAVEREVRRRRAGMDPWTGDPPPSVS